MQKKCSSCGDITELYSYNGNLSCLHCLSMDKRGVPKDYIEDKIRNADMYTKKHIKYKDEQRKKYKR